MNAIAHAKNLVKSAVQTVGAKRFAELSGIPYTSLRDMLSRDFARTSVDALERALNAIPADIAVAAPSSHPQHEPATGIGGEVSRTATAGGIGQ